MNADIITTIEEFEALKDNWDDIYRVDDHATVFMSWPWMRGWIEGETGRWVVIGLRPHKDFRICGFHGLEHDKGAELANVSCHGASYGRSSIERSYWICLLAWLR